MDQSELLSRADMAPPPVDAYPMSPRQRSILIEELRVQIMAAGWAIRALQLGSAIETCTESEDVRILLRSLHVEITAR